jgi:prepilin-type N-terminal cleavage/methylation domain-containing protein
MRKQTTDYRLQTTAQPSAGSKTAVDRRPWTVSRASLRIRKPSLRVSRASLRVDSQKGFTIIEVLVAILILGVIGYILSDILIRSLNNGRKSQVIGNVKQNAQNAMNIMIEDFRNADQIVCTDPTGTSIVMYNKNGTYTRITYFPEVAGTSNGYFEEDIPSPANTVDSLNWCDTTVHPMSNPIKLTDNSIISGVSMIHAQDTSGTDIPFFRVVQNQGNKGSIQTIFAANTSVGNTSNDTTLGSVVKYETTTEIR